MSAEKEKKNKKKDVYLNKSSQGNGWDPKCECIILITNIWKIEQIYGSIAAEYATRKFFKKDKLHYFYKSF